jgi:cation transport regulator ChaC
MILHFAYGSNMSRAIMRRHAPAAQSVGVAELAGCRFVITADGYASVKRVRGHTVHGVLWRLSPRDRVALDTWENTAGGLYRSMILPVRSGGRRVPALVYIARPSGEGRPKPGYMELVIAAAKEWEFPVEYIRSLQRWLPARSPAVGANAGEFG